MILSLFNIEDHIVKIVLPIKTVRVLGVWTIKLTLLLTSVENQLSGYQDDKIDDNVLTMRKSYIT